MGKLEGEKIGDVKNTESDTSPLLNDNHRPARLVVKQPVFLPSSLTA